MSIIVRSTLALATAFAVAGCTSVSSRLAAPSADANNGLVYSLPNRMMDVQVDFSETGDHTIKVQGGRYYADGDDSSRYVARIHRGKVGKVAAKLITSGGLLASADSTYTGQAADFAQAIGSAIGVGQAPGPRGSFQPEDHAHCNRKLTLSHSVALPMFDKNKAVTSFNALGGSASCARVTLTITREGAFAPSNGVKGARIDGLWYRVELPYKVIAQIGDGASTTALIMLPDESPTFFVEMDAGIFADSQGKMVFTNGMLTTYERNNDSEVISLLKLPAGVVAAYATAVGAVFSNFSAAGKHTVNAEVAEINREILRRKVEACNLAISSNQPGDTIKELCNIQPLP